MATAPWPLCVLSLVCYLMCGVNAILGYASVLAGDVSAAKVATGVFTLRIFIVQYTLEALMAFFFRWVTMPRWKPEDLLNHHTPFAIVMLPQVIASLLSYDEFAQEAGYPEALIMAAGAFTSFNEACFCAEAFLPSTVADHPGYRMAHSLLAQFCLFQQILIGAPASISTIITKGPNLVQIQTWCWRSAIQATYVVPAIFYVGAGVRLQREILRTHWRRWPTLKESLRARMQGSPQDADGAIKKS